MGSTAFSSCQYFNIMAAGTLRGYSRQEEVRSSRQGEVRSLLV